MAMIVEVFFFKVEGDMLNIVVAHHSEVIDVADQKSVDRCWSAISDRFAIPLDEMNVFEGYLTHAEVQPTTDSLQRIWLTSLEHEEENIDTELSHLRLRFFVARKPKPQPPPSPAPGAQNSSAQNSSAPNSGAPNSSANANANANASASASANAPKEAGEVKGPLPIGPETNGRANGASVRGGFCAPDYRGPVFESVAFGRGSSGVEPCRQEFASMASNRMMMKLESWLRMLQSINSQLLAKAPFGDQSRIQTMRFIDVMGTAMTTIWKTWYLFTATPLGNTALSNVTIQDPMSAMNPYPFLAMFPGLQSDPRFTNELVEVAQICQIVAVFALTLSHGAANTLPRSREQCSWNRSTFEAVDEYLARLEWQERYKNTADQKSRADFYQRPAPPITVSTSGSIGINSPPTNSRNSQAHNSAHNSATNSAPNSTPNSAPNSTPNSAPNSLNSQVHNSVPNSAPSSSSAAAAEPSPMASCGPPSTSPPQNK